MGSRGQVLKRGGFKRYDYHTIMRYNNIRFVVQNKGKNVKVPEMSNSPWAVYVTLASNGNIKTVSFYNGSRKQYKAIDIADHHGLNPHVHTLNVKTSLRDDDIVPVRSINNYEKARLDKIKDFYNRHNLHDISKNYYEEANKK